MERTLTVAVVLLLASTLLAQVKSDPQLPPDLLHMDRPSCTIVEHTVAEVFNAKTGQPESLYNYRVEPYLEYTDHRDRWELPKETMAFSKELRPGAIGDFKDSHTAIDTCSAWIKKVKAAALAESKKAGHGGPKVTPK